MSTRILGLTALLGLAVGLGGTPTPGQERPAGAKPLQALDPAKLPPLGQQMFRAAQRGADWLRRANRPDGRFVPGHEPALRSTLEGDNYLHQASAARGLARAARLLGDERLGAVARQAVLTLLLDTTIDPMNPQVRHIALPDTVVSRLAAAAYLVLAIHELPAPGTDLLDQSDQLCRFLCSLQQPDGSLRSHGAAGLPGGDPSDGLYTGLALQALVCSNEQRPEAWKMEAVGQALAFSRGKWQKTTHPVPGAFQTAACAEWFLHSKDRAYADLVFAINDRLCGLQVTQLDARHPLWLGGFRDSADARPSTAPTQAATAASTESLAHACRVARQLGDLPRYQRYHEALERGLQFLTTLQYTEANTQHFADWYRPLLLGGFFAGHQDGTLRLEDTAGAVAALVQYVRGEMVGW